MGIPIVSLFCGCGGLDLGFSRVGFDVILALDVDTIAVATYNLNHDKSSTCGKVNAVAEEGDLAELVGEDIIQMLQEKCPGVSPKGVIGGPPCQPFSNSNVHAKSDDTRRALPGKYATILKVLNEFYDLDFFVFENVRGITYARHEAEFAHFRTLFKGADFRLHEDLLDAANFGVPQKRPRVFVVGLNKTRYGEREFDFPQTDGSPDYTLADAIADLPEPRFFERGLAPEDIPHHPNHWTMQPKSSKFHNGSLKEGQSKGRSFRVLSWTKPSWTVAYGNREIHIHPSGKRRLSIYEAMLLQGFPDTYQLLGTLSDQVNQVCDAVPPPVAQALAESIRLFLLQEDLLSWFQQERRDFPWRCHSDPYAILVAEKLLQQTAARDVVVEAYERFLELYPTPEHLAVAEIPDLEEIIRPLGLIYRAQELQTLAQEIVSRHNGEIPRKLEALLALTGIGDYCARAVLSFAFGRDVPIVDTNVARFLYRLFGIPDPMPANPARKKRLIELAGTLVPSGRSKEFNLAILDLCSETCRLADPTCSDCPVKQYCVYGTRGGSS